MPLSPVEQRGLRSAVNAVAVVLGHIEERLGWPNTQGAKRHFSAGLRIGLCIGGRARKLETNRYLTVDGHLRLEEERGGDPFDKLYLHPQCLARTDHPFEPNIVHPSGDRDFACGVLQVP